MGYQKIKNPAKVLDFLHSETKILILKQFQLRIFSRWFPLFLFSKELH